MNKNYILIVRTGDYDKKSDRICAKSKCGIFEKYGVEIYFLCGDKTWYDDGEDIGYYLSFPNTYKILESDSLDYLVEIACLEVL